MGFQGEARTVSGPVSVAKNPASCPKNLSEAKFRDNGLISLTDEKYVCNLKVSKEKRADNKTVITVKETEWNR